MGIKLKNKIFIFVLLIFLGTIILLTVYNVVSINQLAKDCVELKGNLESIKQENIFLINRVNELEKPERIIQIANESLNMNLPQKPAKELSFDY